MSATSTDTGSSQGSSGPGGRRRVAVIVIAIVVLAAVVIAVVAAIRGGSSGAGGATPSEGPAFPSDPSATSTPITSQDPADGQEAPDEAPPVALDETAEPVPGLVASIGTMNAVDGQADGPGEIAGPALSFTVTVENRTDEEVSLMSTVVTVATGADVVPADALATGSAPLPAEVEAGGTVTGTYVFTVPIERRDDVRITFDYLAGTPAVVFQGAAPRP